MSEMVVHTPSPVAPTDTDSWTHVAHNVFELAERIANTEFVPKALRGKPPAVAAAMFYGREVGLPPMTSLTQTHVIEGTPSISAEAMRALVFAAGHEIVVRESSAARCRLAGRRRGWEEWSTVTWTIEDARKAGLLKLKSGWEKYPRAMLKARATAELCRDVFPDVIHGFRAFEEVTDALAPDVLADETPPTNTVQRKPRKPRGTVVEVAPSMASDRAPVSKIEDTELPEVIDLPDEDVEEAPPDVALPSETTPEPPPVEEAEKAPPEAPQATERREPGDEGRPILRAMLRGLLARFTELGVTDRDQRLRVTSVLVGRPITSANDLNRGEASGLWDTLNLCHTIEDLNRVVATTEEYATRKANGETAPVDDDQLTFGEVGEELWPEPDPDKLPW